MALVAAETFEAARDAAPLIAVAYNVDPHCTTVSVLLRSPVPIVLLWGPDGIMIYNDAYSIFAGGRHPLLFGSKVREGWPEVADFNDNVMKVGLSGGTLSYRNQDLTLHRSGVPEQVWMNLDYSPVLGEDGRPGGGLAILSRAASCCRSPLPDAIRYDFGASSIGVLPA